MSDFMQKVTGFFTPLNTFIAKEIFATEKQARMAVAYYEAKREAATWLAPSKGESLMNIFDKFGSFLSHHSTELHTVASALEVLLAALPLPVSEKGAIVAAVSALHTSADNIADTVGAIKAQAGADGTVDLSTKVEGAALIAGEGVSAAEEILKDFNSKSKAAPITETVA